MRCVVVLALLVLGVASSTDFLPKELRKSPMMPTQPIRHKFILAGSNSTQIEVRAQHTPGVLSVDAARDVDMASCATDSITADFENRQAAEEFLAHARKANIVTASALIGCKKSAIRHRVGEPTIQDNSVTIPTKKAALKDAFKHVDVQAQVKPEELVAWTSSCTRTAIVEGDCSANVHSSHSFSGWNVNYNNKEIYSHGYFGATLNIECTSCYAKLTPSVGFSLSVHDNSLSSFELYVQGKFDAKVTLKATLEKKYSDSYSKTLGTYSLPSATFFIGAVPVDLDFTIPVAAWVQFNADAKIVATTGISASDSLTAGLKYTSGWSKVASNSPSWSYSRPSGTITSSATLKGGLTPSLKVEIDDVASITATVKPYLQADMNGKNTAFHGDLKAICDVDVAGDLGLDLFDVHIGPQKTWGPYQVWTGERTLWSA